MVHGANSIKQIRKYFVNNGSDMTDNQCIEIYSRGRDDFSLSGGCDTLKEFVEADKERNQVKA
jgi:hypothetical protein